MRRFSPALLSMLVLLLVGGLVLAFIAKRLFAREAPVVVDDRTFIPMALQDIEPGTVITSAHIGRGPVARTKLEREHILSNEAVIGRIAKNRIKAVQPISTIDLYAPGEFPSLDIGPGMRAVSVDLGDGAATVDGIVRPGDFVDVVFTPGSFPDVENTGGLVMTLFKGVKVAGLNRNRLGTTDTREQRVNRGSNTVTLELTPEQANILILARGKGELNLTYTKDGPGDGQIALKDKDRATFREILGLKEPERPTPTKPEVTEVYAGHSRRLALFVDGKYPDVYAIHNADTLNPYGGGFGGAWGAGTTGNMWGGGYGGGYGGYGGYGSGFGDWGNTTNTHPADTEPNGNRGNYDFGNGYWSVPNGAPGTGSGATAPAPQNFNQPAENGAGPTGSFGPNFNRGQFNR